MGVADPQKLSREEYYRLYADYLYLKKIDRTFLLNVVKQAIIEAFNGDPNI